MSNVLYTLLVVILILCLLRWAGYIAGSVFIFGGPLGLILLIILILAVAGKL